MMHRTARVASLALALALMPGVWACAEREEPAVETAEPAEEVAVQPLRVTELDLGNAIGADKRLTDDNDTDEFRPTDTIYAVVSTEGAGNNATLTARWTFSDGQVVEETSQTVSPTGPAVTEFHISKPDGFPTGEYRVEILLNGQSVDTEDFEVK